MPSAPFPAVRSLRHGVLGAQAWVDSGHLDPESNARVQESSHPRKPLSGGGGGQSLGCLRGWRGAVFRHILPHQQPQFSPSP